jgi:hypothetical protein
MSLRAFAIVFRDIEIEAGHAPHLGLCNGCEGTAQKPASFSLLDVLETAAKYMWEFH